MILTNPVWDEAAGSISYDVTLLEPEQAGDGLAHLAGRHTGTELPESLGPVSLFIDSAGGLSCGEYTSCWNDTTGLIIAELPGGEVVDACMGWSTAREPCDDYPGSWDDLVAVCIDAYPDPCKQGDECLPGGPDSESV